MLIIELPPLKEREGGQRGGEREREREGEEGSYMYNFNYNTIMMLG